MATNDEIDPIGILDLPEQVIDPDNPNWHILPVVRGIDDHFMKIWRICKKHQAMIIGGYARYMISPNAESAPANDIDVFLYANDQTPLMDVDERFKKLQVEFAALFDFEKEGPLSWYYSNQDSTQSVNLIQPRVDDSMVTVGTLYDIIEMMDFPIVRCGLKSLEEAVADPDFVHDETDKELHWKNINCPIAAVFRMMKYSKKGYFARPRDVVKLFQDWDKRGEAYQNRLITLLNINDPNEEDIMAMEELLWAD